jgi:hypothetical protein
MIPVTSKRFAEGIEQSVDPPPARAFNRHDSSFLGPGQLLYGEAVKIIERIETHLNVLPGANTGFPDLNFVVRETTDRVETGNGLSILSHDFVPPESE